VIEKRLENWRLKNPQHAGQPRMLVGGNIGKNKSTPNEDAWKDYETCFVLLHPYVDFFVVNVSSPNTPGLRELQDKDALKRILTRLQEENKRFDKQKPILLKIAPDLTDEQINDVIDLVKEIALSGLVATNTTISREGLTTDPQSVEKMGAGGLSGAPLEKRATECIDKIYARSHGAIPVIGSGGIFNAADARQKLEAGASLVEVWTGFIYEGPAIVKNILKGLP
jgi:dihydroorotate dehydrogenase